MTTLDERIREAEREVMQRDRQLRERIGDVTQHARAAARSGGRFALVGAGAAAASWLGWRLVNRLRGAAGADERKRRQRLEAARRAGYRHGHGLPDPGREEPAGKPKRWRSLLRLALLIVPFVAPAHSPAAAAASAVQRGGSWPLRLSRLARSALKWQASRKPPAPAAGDGRARLDGPRRG